LKLVKTPSCKPLLHVAPFTGAWIETLKNACELSHISGRPLHGGVD